ncbi:MAG: SH3 domain-containing protein, partial [Eubacterium sp.]|nr:SH3 domain-containing protein [Eubacterium sp.]
AVIYMPDVTEEMTQASYWSAKTQNSHVTIADQSGVEDFNKKAIATEGTHLLDLKEYAISFDGISLSQKLLAAEKEELTAKIGKWYDNQGQTITEEYVKEIYENVENSQATSQDQVQYAVVVKPSVLRAYPTDKALLDDPGDSDFDNLYLSGVRVNEPLLIQSTSKDQKYYYVQSESCPGWILAEDIAVCKSRDQWLDAWDYSGSTLVVYDDKIYTEDSNTNPDTANRKLTMGTKLHLLIDSQVPVVDNENIGGALGVVEGTNRAAYNNYIVYLPVRGEDGSYEKQLAFISQSAKVKEGFLPLTVENILGVAFEALGNTYGWGGMLSSNDCSGYVRDVYACFGIKLARNTTWQMAMPVKNYDLSQMSDQEKKNCLSGLPGGSLLYFKGHVMMYLGCQDDKYYVISSTSTIMDPDGSGKQRARGVIINTLDTKRANGNSWLTSLIDVRIPFLGENSTMPEMTDWGMPLQPSSREGLKIKDSGNTYTITSVEESKRTVALTKAATGKKTIKIPKTITRTLYYQGVDNKYETYKVTKIGKKAFARNKKVKKIVLGENISQIGKYAFSNCKKLRNLVIKTKKLKKSGLTKTSLKGISKKVKIKVPKGKKKAYTKLFRKKGLGKKIKIKV